jgi:cyclopropane fatty-acyl-phospholipid synthase-like methyltransferase
MSDIKSMGLYRRVDRILSDLEAAGIGADDVVTVDDLTSFDQYHYEGTDAVDEAIEELGAGPDSTILDVGSGIGGPARYMADRTGSRVMALELQPDLHETASSLTRRCGLENLVSHVNGDILTGVAPTDGFSGLVSMLCFLHIPDRANLFHHCARALRPSGVMFIDDYYQVAPFTDAERASLAEKVYCTYLPDVDTYEDDVRSAGFIDVSVADKTADWTRFVIDRARRFEAARDSLIARYGRETVDGLDDFYSTVAGLFTNGSLGGVRLVARLPDGD